MEHDKHIRRIRRTVQEVDVAQSPLAGDMTKCLVLDCSPVGCRTVVVVEAEVRAAVGVGQERTASSCMEREVVDLEADCRYSDCRMGKAVADSVNSCTVEELATEVGREDREDRCRPVEGLRHMVDWNPGKDGRPLVRMTWS